MASNIFGWMDSCVPRFSSFIPVILVWLAWPLLTLFVSRYSAVASALVMMVAIPLTRMGTAGKDVLEGDERSRSNPRTLRGLLFSGARAVMAAERTHTVKTPERLGCGGRNNSHRRTKSASNGDDRGYAGVSSFPINRLEQAITHLAGAVGVGTEPLIYVRRSDVAEVVDSLLCQARKPGGPEFNSPALERLAIVRRSAGKYLSGSVNEAIRCPGSSTRKGSVTRGRNLNEAFRDWEAKAKIPASDPRESPSVKVERARGGDKVEPGGDFPAAESSRASPFRRSPNKSRGFVGNAARRGGSGWDGDHPRAWRMRSPPRIPYARPSSSLPDEKIMLLPKPLSAAPKAGAIVPEAVTGQDSKSPNPTASSRKIAFLPITPRASPGAGGAFEDFWSTGLT